MSNNHWRKPTSVWELFTSPLRPNAEDINFLKTEVLPRISNINSQPQKIAVLGVTPEFTSLPWVQDTEITAIDNSCQMIANVWDTIDDDRTIRKSILSDWQNIPLADHSCDCVFGDGCFTLLSYPDTYHQVLQEIKRILKPNGIFSLRVFLRPEQPQTVAEVFADLEAGKIANFNLFRWLLAITLQTNTSEGIAVQKVYQTWQQEVSNPEILMAKLGWSTDLLATIKMYENSSMVYTFPTQAEIEALFSKYFQPVSYQVPTYQSGELFPTIIWRKQN